MSNFSSKQIGATPQAQELTDDTLIPIEQTSQTMHLTGAQFRSFAVAAAEARVEDAENAAEDAAASADKAKGDQEKIASQLTQAQAAQTAAAKSASQAAAAKQAILDMGVSASASDPGSAASVEKSTDASGRVTLKFTIPRGVAGPMGTILDISRTAGDGSSGSTDTYTITCSDGSTANFYVYNGKDGEGQGDMTAAIYDPTGKKQDIFAYVDKAIEDAIGAALGGEY